MKNSKGTVLVTVSIISMVIFMLLAFMLNSLTNEMRTSMRSADAKKAEDLVQAGIEQGIAFIKDNPYQTTSSVITNPFGYINVSGSIVSHSLSWDVVYDKEAGKYNIHSVAQYGAKIKKQLDVSYVPEKDFEVKDYLDSSKLPLDSIGSYSNGLAFSLRKLRAGYAGAAIQITTGGAVSYDIGFDKGGNLDEAAIKTAIGAGGAVVSRWYNQAVNADCTYIEQTDTTSRPAIASAGEIIKVNGRPAIQFDGTNDHLLSIGDYPNLNSDSKSFISVFKADFSTPSIMYILRKALNVGIKLQSNSSLQYDTVNVVNFGKQYYNKQTINTFIQKGSNVDYFYNGYIHKKVNAGISTIVNSTKLHIGCTRDGTGLIEVFKGTMSEIIAVERTAGSTTTSALSDSERIAIEQNQANYYNVQYTKPTYNENYIIDYVNRPPHVAYSLRKLNSQYNGYAIKVRNSTTASDIGFDGAGNLDKTALMKFAGSGNAMVHIWYDQSGFGRNLTQTTPSNRLHIVTNGAINMANGKPTIKSDKSDYMIADIKLKSESAGVSLVAATNGGSETYPRFVSVGNFPVSDEITSAGFSVNSGQNRNVVRFARDNVQDDLGPIPQKLFSFTGIFTSKKMNGIVKFETNQMKTRTLAGNAMGFNSSRFKISGNVQDLIGTSVASYSEIILWEDDITGYRDYIQRNQKAYYNIN